MMKPDNTIFLAPSLSVRKPSTGPINPPSIRVNDKARDSAPRFQPKWFSNATDHNVIAWNRGTVATVITNPVAITMYQP